MKLFGFAPVQIVWMLTKDTRTHRLGLILGVQQLNFNCEITRIIYLEAPDLTVDETGK